MSDEIRLPAVDSVWGNPDDVASWCRFIGVDDDRGYHWETWRGEFFETELSREPSAVDIKALVTSNQQKLDFLKSRGLTVGTMQESGKSPYLMYVIEPGSELCDMETVNKLVDAEVQRDKAIELLKRCYTAGHRQGWEEGESNAECFAAVNDFLSNMLGGDWDMLGMAEVATAFVHDLDQQFTVEWLVEIGGELAHPQEHESVVGFWSQAYREWTLRYSTIEGWTWCGKKMTQIAPAITTRRDVLKWLDVLGIEAEREWKRHHGHGG